MTRALAVEQWSRQLLQRVRPLTVEEAIREAGGIYSTAPTSYLSLAARLPRFTRDNLDRALYRDRTLVRLSVLRGSAFLVPLSMVDHLAAASGRGDRIAGWADKIVGTDQRMKWREQILGMLGGRIMGAREIKAELGVLGRESEALSFVIGWMSAERDIAAATGVKGWRDNQYGYALWGEWFVGNEPVQIDGDEARTEVAKWYLQGHGPGTVGHFSWWAGMKKADAAAALAQFEEVGEGVYDVSEPPVPVEPSGLRLLPVWDTALVAPKGRRRMVRTAHQPFVYDASGNLTSTIVLDGGVIGVWDRGGDNDSLHIKAAGFETLTPSTRRAIETEAGVIASAVGATDVVVDYVPGPTNLLESTRNRFLSPLSGS